ncbi:MULTISPECIES: GntR family transcriptional regulator [Propionimicrobium]|uniref:HTH gntR-type domain-containing protein n=1 Tax=Propionimicrobium lymphophilum ACS-093-V-SCH5 TaxID=883161 RepID=S2X129_9ACTN|nr:MULTISPECIES: GntR family transcriptional regulator [Propionimicrobium]EPD33704.1 hypothetical protein HMPREF9306_00462 [Propionimicrobium lymphophilum ACS-093-V-SCH5]ETJ97462.1 transcriptional regulator, GntR family [Propionimicrobium sp. BV2F7]
MEFDTKSPIWLQLVEEFSRRICVGEWQTGARLPGVRDLAADLKVNPNTVQRALAELDRQGITYSERTSGRFVTENKDTISALRTQQAFASADSYISACIGLGIDTETAKQLIADRWDEILSGVSEGTK